MHPKAQYYLHTNGDLIFKPHGGVDVESDFVVQAWNANVIGESPGKFAMWLLDCYRMGAKQTEIKRLADHFEILTFIPKLKPEFERLGITGE